MAKRLQGVGSPLQDPAWSFPAGEVHNGVSKEYFPPLAPLLLSLPSSWASLFHKGQARPWADKASGLKSLSEVCTRFLRHQPSTFLPPLPQF